MKVRLDLWGFADLIAVDDQPGVLAIQATTTAHQAHRLAKAGARASAAWQKREKYLQRTRAAKGVSIPS